jgi:ankyrin repeat protein
VRTMKTMKSKWISACLGGSVDDVKAALTGGGSIVATDEEESTGLSLACDRRDWDVALPIVKLLLANRFGPSMTDEDGWNALHCAARSSSAEVVALLLRKMRKLVNNITNNRDSALSLYCVRDDEEAVNVARLLLDAGADLETVEAEYSRTPLLVACRQSRPELVSLLLELGADVNAVDSEGDNVLTLACCNGVFGRERIPLLVKAGIDVLHKDNDGRDAMGHALRQSGAMAETLGKFLPVDYQLGQFYTAADPIGSKIVGTKFRV